METMYPIVEYFGPLGFLNQASLGSLVPPAVPGALADEQEVTSQEPGSAISVGP